MSDKSLQSMVQACFSALVRPKETFDRMATTPAKWTGLVAVTTMGVMYTVLMWVLATSKSMPSYTRGLITEPAVYYKTAALYIFPLLVFLWFLFTATAHGVAKSLGGKASFETSMGALGVAYSVPILLFFVIPDLLLMAVGGHELLTASVRYTASLTGLSLFLLSVFAVRGIHKVSMGKSIIAVVVALVVHAPLAGWLIR